MAPEEQDRCAGPPSGQPGSALDRLCERLIVGLHILILAYAVLAWGTVRQSEAAVVEAMVALLLGLWIVRLWASPNPRLFWPPICWAALAFLALAVVRCHFVDVPYPARQELARVVVCGAVFFAALNNANRSRWTVGVAAALILLASALSVTALFQYWEHGPSSIWGWVRPTNFTTRGSGTFVNPDHFAGFLELTAPLALAGALLCRIRLCWRILLGGAAFLMAAGVFVSLSRGGIVALAAAFSALLLTLLFRRRHRLGAGLALAGLLSAGILFAAHSGSFYKRFHLIGEELPLRVDMWRVAVKLFKTEPVWGVGPGLYDHKFFLYRGPGAAIQPVFAHSDYLQTLCEWGVIGAALVGAALVILLLGCLKTWRAIRRKTDEPDGGAHAQEAFLAGAGFGLFAILLHCLIDFQMHVPPNALIAVTWMALLSGQLRLVSARHWVPLSPPLRVAATAAAAAALLWLAHQSWMDRREGCELNVAEHYENSLETRIAAYRRALECEPHNPRTLAYLGNALRRLGIDELPSNTQPTEEALVVLQKAMVEDPYYSRNPMWYGICLDSLGKTNESLPWYEKACAIEPNGQEAWLYLARHYLVIEDYETARTLSYKSIKLRYDVRAENYLWVAEARMARHKSLNTHPAK